MGVGAEVGSEGRGGRGGEGGGRAVGKAVSEGNLAGSLRVKTSR